MADEVYKAIVRSVRAGRLREPFSARDFRRACPGFSKGIYSAFLPKHAAGSRLADSVLFERVAPGKYTCIRPFRYGL